MLLNPKILSLEFSYLENFFRKIRKTLEAAFWRAHNSSLNLQAMLQVLFSRVDKTRELKTKIPQNNVVQNEILYFTKKRFIPI